MNNRIQLPAKSRKKFKLRRFVWQWHRRFGVAIAVFVVLLSITGILLNHTDSLDLDGINIQNPAILSLYGIEKPVITSFSASNHWFGQLDQQIYFNESTLPGCSGILVGVVTLSVENLFALVCQNEMLLVSNGGELVERIGDLYQLPIPVSGTGACDKLPCLQSENSHFLIDINELSWQKTNPDLYEPIQQVSAPNELLTFWQQNYIGQAISLERFILDVHSGRILGSFGVLIMDLSAILLSVLVISGVWLWLKSLSPKR